MRDITYQIYPSSQSWTGWSVGRVRAVDDSILGEKERHILVMDADVGMTKWVDLFEESKHGYVMDRNSWHNPGLACSVLAAQLLKEEHEEQAQSQHPLPN